MASQNSIDNTVSDNDFSVNRATVGTPVVSTVSHSDNTNTASNAKSQLTVGGSAGGDPATTYTVTGGSSWSHGIDNTDSDKFILAASTDLGTTNVMEVFVTGEMNFPLQPAFLSFAPVNIPNQTGTGTIATVAFATEVFDVNGDFATNVFTAPVTGVYSLGTQVILNNVGTSDVGSCRIVTSNRTYNGGSTQNLGVTKDSNTDLSLFLAALTDMDAADTARVHGIAGGQAGDTIGFFGDPDPNTYFYGKLEQ